MNKIKAWVSTARLRTLPLSVSGIIVGSALGHKNFIGTTVFWLAIATTLGLQILSNFANDYGDGVKGTDNEDRIGPERALQSGIISRNEMKKSIILTSILTLVVAIALIYAAFGKENFLYSIFFFVLGVIAIIAAIQYTVGNSAYGYKGYGDVFVFIFFGLVSVVGCYFLFSKQLTGSIFLPAITIGLLSTAVLNLNNMRDHDSDKKAGKNTLVVKLGVSASRKYHFILILGAMLAMFCYGLILYEKPINLLFVIAFIPLIVHLRKVSKVKQPKLLDPELKKVALTTFLLSILFSLSQIL
ncbi:1,4-dihydroxy-2-naphthoate polyprenyltransferase [Aquimarina gracilis]|uniref:1,4-dihydroxy-2-naphthoate octaprenyltransferase n=1 Tax=Aquimarina gracilis TaxID=874422 RepID=A0ABU6A1Y1_9FLAO|nr:1,4-dihydroxy-2-naphthoate polyprenyltransferase [Aquimarina gracilis]MEB3348096.1 1,4-dihydroxy-2-naphthoate polyprenyltransferase [Aquimarina gracilis]